MRHHPERIVAVASDGGETLVLLGERTGGGLVSVVGVGSSVEGVNEPKTAVFRRAMAVAQADAMKTTGRDTKAKSVVFAVDSKLCRTEIKWVGQPVYGPVNEVDMRLLRRKAVAVFNRQGGHEFVARLPICLDDKPCPKLEGKIGKEISLNWYRCEVSSEVLANRARLVRSCGFSRIGGVSTGEASALAVTSQSERDAGLWVAHLGYESIHFAAYGPGGLVTTFQRQLGLDDLARELGRWLDVGVIEAREVLLDESRWADSERATGVWTGWRAQPPELFVERLVDRYLRRIFSEVSQQSAPGLGKRVPCVLSGPGALLPRIEEEASRVFGVPCRVDYANPMAGGESYAGARELFSEIPQSIWHSKYAVVAGLLVHAATGDFRPIRLGGFAKFSLSGLFRRWMAGVVGMKSREIF